MRQVVIAAAALMLIPVIFVSCGRDKNSQDSSTPSGVLTGIQEVSCDSAAIVSRVTMSAFTLVQTPEGNEYFSREGCTPVGSQECSSVTIQAGQTVQWVNGITDQSEYWWWKLIFSENRRWPVDGSITPGESLCLTFNEPGTYSYKCADPVTGTVIVQ